MSEEDDSIIDLTTASSDGEEAQSQVAKTRSAPSHEHWLHSAPCRSIYTDSWPCRPPPAPVRSRGRTTRSQTNKGTGASAPATIGAAASRGRAFRQAAAAREQAALGAPDGAAGCKAGKRRAAPGQAGDVQPATKAVGKPAANVPRTRIQAHPPSAAPETQHSRDASEEPTALLPDVAASLAKPRGRDAGGVSAAATSEAKGAAAAAEPAATSDATAETETPTTSQPGTPGSTLAHRQGGSQQPVAGEATAGKGDQERNTKRQQSVGLHPFALLVENQAALLPKGRHGDPHKPSSKQVRAPSQDAAAASSSSFRSLAGHGAGGGGEETPAADRQGPGTDGPSARGSHCQSQEPPVLCQGQVEAWAGALSQARPRRQMPAGQVWGRAEGSALSEPSARASPQTKSRAAPASRPAAIGQAWPQPAAQPEAVPCTKRAAAEKRSSKGAGRAAAPSSAALSAPVQQEAGEDFDVDIDLDPEAPGEPLLVPGGG